ncbi:thiocillin/thiostrepton family thiazolyl peptide [Streptomyces sp. NPDC005202]|uniref:thiocillin/thiostrepton family thiazolyl peptide n=1 Tax=Streptomyces sp. NPDC005202 TaxID=3157021 RepID=UPI0033BA79F8
MDNIQEIDLNALEISDLIADAGKDDETLSQVMAASCTTSGCACSSSSSSSS